MKLLPVFIVGMVLGLAAGLVYAWGISPVEYINTFPPYLDVNYRKDWIRMSALAYGLEGNLDRTFIRLQDLPADEIHFVLLETLEEAAGSNFDMTALESLAKLAAEYGVSSPMVSVYTEQQIMLPEIALTTSTASPTPQPIATVTPIPSATPTLVPTESITSSLASPYTVISHTLICSEMPTIAVVLELTSTLGAEFSSDISRTLGFSPTVIISPSTEMTSSLAFTETMDLTATLELSKTPALTATATQVIDTQKPPVHSRNWGREIWLMWDTGADRAFTGFRPEYGLGYADFAVEPGLIYNLYIDNPWGVPVIVIQVEPCTPDEGGGWISRKLVIVEGLE